MQQAPNYHQMMEENNENQSNFEFEQIDTLQIEEGQLALEPWRMNLIAFDSNRNHLYIGSRNEIKGIAIVGGLFVKGLKKLFTLKLYDEGDVINQLTIKQQQGEGPNKKEFLVAVTMLCRVYIYDLQHITLKPIVLNNKYDNIEDCSTWSVDLHLGLNYSFLAVGSNSQIISIWNLSNLNPQKLNLEKKDKLEIDKVTAPLPYKLLEDNQYSDYPIRYSIFGNSNNIPCVRFSPCGQYIASVSIDKNLRIFSVQNAQQICTYQLNDWGWGIEWVLKSQISKQVDQSLIAGINQYLLIASLKKEIELFEIKDDHILLVKGINEIQQQQHCRFSILHYISQLKTIFAVYQHSSIYRVYLLKQDEFNGIYDMKQEKCSQEFSQNIRFIGAANKMSETSTSPLSAVLLLSLDGQVFLNKLQQKQDD